MCCEGLQVWSVLRGGGEGEQEGEVGVQACCACESWHVQCLEEVVCSWGEGWGRRGEEAGEGCFEGGVDGKDGVHAVGVEGGRGGVGWEAEGEEGGYEPV